MNMAPMTLIVAVKSAHQTLIMHSLINAGNEIHIHKALSLKNTSL